MRKLIALAVMTIATQGIAAFAGEPVVSSKQVIAPPQVQDLLEQSLAAQRGG
jgi:hypothetical protein